MSETVTILFRSHAGEETEVDAEVGQSVMQAAILANVDGIEAECGGSCMCATCHVYLDEALADRLGAASEDEDDLLDSAASERRPTSRLSCQVTVTADLAGAVFELPERQT